MDRVDNYNMGRRTRSRDLTIVIKVGGDYADFLAVVEGMDSGVVERDEKVAKELIDEF